MRVAAALLLCACSLAQLPDASFPCSVDADCLSGRCVLGTCRGTLPDSGVTDAGPRDGGVDSGTPDGGAPDGGPPDGGAPDAGDAGFTRRDAGALYCNSWACASSGFVPWDGGVFFDTAQCPAVDGGGHQPWFGAVLARSGNVVGIPKGARHPLRVSPSSLKCETFGKELDADAGWWMSGVLGSDGLIYAAPYSATRILRIDEGEDGGRAVLELWGPDLTLAPGIRPGFIGSALDRDGNIWMVSGDGNGIARVSPDGGLKWFLAGWNLWGISRIEPGTDDLLVSVPSSGSGFITVVDPRRDDIVTGPSALPQLLGAQLRLDGGLISLGYVASVAVHLRVSSDAGVAFDVVDAGGLQLGFATIGPDGEAWAMPRNNNSYVVRVDPDGPTPHAVPFSGPEYTSCAVIATPQGIIGLPCEGNDRVMRLRLSSGEHRTMQQLLSPFFNKL